ncbi:MAG: glycosyltransferase [Chitinophagaceae bacterium]|nr:glycosyltransferase [Chitinophagaceae bacterium]
MSKKVLYISYDGMTDPLGQSQVIPYLEGLSRMGYVITIFSFEKKQRLAEQEQLIRSLLDNAGISWEYELFSVRPPFLSKLYDSRKMKKKAVSMHKKHRFDFVHCRSYVAAEAGLLLARKYDLPFLFDMRGFWVDERVDNGQWKLANPLFRFLYKRYKKKESAYFTYSRHVISLTWKGKEELNNVYNVPPDKVTVIPCCVDLAHFDYHKISHDAVLRKKAELGLDRDSPVISYLGSLGGWYLEKEMLDFFVELKKIYSNARFLFITRDPAEKVKQAAVASGANTQDIIVVPAFRRDVPLLLALSDWSIFFIKDAYSKRASSPTKQGEIMAMGIPLVCNDIGDTGRIVRESGSGIVINEFNTAEYSQAIAKMGELKHTGKEHIRSAAFAYYDLAKGTADYAAVYKKMTG